MAKSTITIKSCGPSKKFPEKYGWILDNTDPGTFWNVSLAEATEAKNHIGSTCVIQHHTNPKGYTQVDGIVFGEGKPASNGHAPSNGSGPEKGMIIKESVALLAAGKTPNQVLGYFRSAEEIYRRLKSPESEDPSDSLDDTF